MRLLAVVSYKGTNYFGWQRQPNVITIQQVIEEKISQYFNREIIIYGAGRTDAGVHALGQRFHFDIDLDEIDLDRFLYSINQMLPPDIKIEDIEEVESSFHARYSAKGKVYLYSILEDSKDPFLYDTVFLHPEHIDVDRLEEALHKFIGKHNFKNFTSKEEDEDNFVREIYDIQVRSERGYINISFNGDGFMRYMIRFIVGTCLRVVDKDEPLELIDNLLDENSERNITSFKAPSHGLTLLEVQY